MKNMPPLRGLHGLGAGSFYKQAAPTVLGSFKLPEMAVSQPPPLASITQLSLDVR
jgi:hypothetical protein